MNINDKNFDGDYLLKISNDLSREEAINLLGPVYSQELLTKLNNHSLTIDELDKICLKAYPTYELRAHWIRNIIHSKLNKYELLGMYGVLENQIDQVRMIDEYKTKVSNGTISEDELYELCSIVFDNEEVRNIVFDKLKEQLKNKAK